MTAVYAIAALVIIAGIMLGAYLVGFGDGIEAEKMRRTCYVVQKVFSHDNVEETPPGGVKHRLPHADRVQMEAEAKNKESMGGVNDYFTPPDVALYVQGEKAKADIEDDETRRSMLFIDPPLENKHKKE